MPLLFIYVLDQSGLGTFHKIVEKEKYFLSDEHILLETASILPLDLTM